MNARTRSGKGSERSQGSERKRSSVRKQSSGRSRSAAPADRSPAERKASHRRRRQIMKTSELIARDIILEIAEQGLQEGDALPSEAKMLEFYQVGRASLREALRLLEVQRLIRIRPGANGGPVVGAATPGGLARMMTLHFGLAHATYEDLTDVMLILHPVMARVVARRKLSKAEKQALLYSADPSTSEPMPSLANIEQLGEFHALLAELARNPIWSLVVTAIDTVFQDHVIATTSSGAFYDTAVADHKAVAEAIIAGDEDKAADVMLQHAKRTVEFYRAQNPGIFSRLVEWQ